MPRPTSPILSGILLLLLISEVLGAGDSKNAEEQKPLQYYELTPSVVANVQNGAKYLRADIQLMTREDGGIDEIKLHAPALRHELFLLISDQNGTELKSLKGKEKFRKDALKSMRKIMQELAGKEMVEELFFTSYFVQ